MKKTFPSDDYTKWCEVDLETLRHLFRTWDAEFGDREIDVFDLRPATATGAMLLDGHPFYAERLEFRLHWLHDVVAAGLKLIRVRPGKWRVIPVGSDFDRSDR